MAYFEGPSSAVLEAVRRRGPELTVALTCLIFFAVGLSQILRDAPLGYDEGVYSAHAKRIANGDPTADWFRGFRAPGLPWLLAQLPIGLGATRFRVVVLAFGVACLVLTWLVGRVLASSAVGAGAAVGLASSPIHLEASTLVHPDVPGAALGLAVVLVFLLGLERDQLPWWTLTLVLLAAAATWVRFGAPIGIGPALALVALLRWRTLLPQWRRVVVLGALTGAVSGAILYVPQLTGRAQISVMAAREDFRSGRTTGLFHSLPDFRDLAPDALGPWGLWIAVGALALLIAGTVARERRIPPGAWLTLAIAALTLTLLSSTLLHGEGRYLAPVLPWAFLAVAAVVVQLAREARPAWVWTAVLALTLVVPWTQARELEAMHDGLFRQFGPLREAALAIAASPEFPCPVMTTQVGQVEWYSGCSATQFAGRPGDPVLGSSSFTLLLRQDAPRQPDSDAFEDYLETATTTRAFDPGGAAARPVWIYGYRLAQ